MMRSALEYFGQRFLAIKVDRRDAGAPQMFAGPMTLVRVLSGKGDAGFMGLT
jgi:hypothetical protein